MTAAATAVMIGSTTLVPFAPLIAFVMVLLIGAASRPAPLPRSVGLIEEVERVGAVDLFQPAQAAGVEVHAAERPRTTWAVHPKRPRPASAQDAANWCDELARALRSGATLTAAVRTSSSPQSISPLVDQLCLSLDRGHPIGAALQVAAAPSALVLPSPHVSMVLTVLRACAEHGGPAAEPLDRAAATLRTRAADRADRLTQSAQARMSAVVMTCLPVGMLALMTLTSASVRSAVVSPAGIVALAIGATLNAVGWLWMRRTINGAES